MSAPLFDFNAGDTWDPTLAWTDDAGAAVDLTGSTITCHVRTQDDTLVQVCTCTILDQVASRGRFRVLATAAQTTSWPVGTLVTNVRVAFGDGTVRSTREFAIVVRRPPTRGA